MAIILTMCPKQKGGLLKLHRTTGKPRDPNPKPMFALIASHAGSVVALTLESRPISECVSFRGCWLFAENFVLPKR